MTDSLVEAIESGAYFKLSTINKSGNKFEELSPHLWLIKNFGIAYVREDWNFKVNSSNSAHKILGKVVRNDDGFWTINDGERGLSWKIVRWIATNKDKGRRSDALSYLLSWEPELINESLLPVKVKA